jgi:hypothetical protein
LRCGTITTQSLNFSSSGIPTRNYSHGFRSSVVVGMGIIQDYWVFGLCPLSDILKTQKNTTFQKLDLFPSSGEGTGDTYSVGPVRKS